MNKLTDLIDDTLWDLDEGLHDLVPFSTSQVGKNDENKLFNSLDEAIDVKLNPRFQI